ncbi:mitochondrial inner membrane protease subunit 2-like [Sycon ciliatum]|uniref:mitochondrial inner membrane protease subunit 2-like n=1 Tax=Sycon ciliatum TaxID=27933 RepID=UPI0031F6DCC4
MAYIRPILKGAAAFGGSFVAVFAGLTVAADVCPYYIDTVSGGSMKPTLNPRDNGTRDRVLAKRLTMEQADKLQRGDIVDATNPRNPHGDKVVKRIIALPGDSVLTPRYHDEVVKIPRYHCWVEGDHPETSADSNYYGPIPVELVHGKVMFVVWPPTRLGRLAERDLSGPDAHKMSTVLHHTPLPR